MAVSMVAKNIGSLAMTAIPWAMEFKYGNDNVDFSISYPWLAGLAMFGGFLMWKNIPAKVAREAGYKIALRNGGKGYVKEMFRPFGLFASSKVWPYYAAFLSFGATESYGLFTTYNIFAKDNVNNIMADTGFSKNTNKLIASSVVTLPSFLVRRFVQRKTGFSQGIVNNVLLTTAGTIGLMIPSEDLSPAANIAIGATSGILIGSGTAHMYQYLQNRMLASVTKDMTLIRKYGSVTGLKTTAQSFYSGANIGLALPLAYSIVAENQKVAEVEKAQFSHDFKVNQKTLPIAFGVYGFGTVPLLRYTPVGKAMSISKFISFPYGAYGIYDLIDSYKRYNMHEYSISTFNLNNQKPLGKINLQLPEPEVYPISYNGISPLPQTNNSSNQK
jgi:hypothetical protein